MALLVWRHESAQMPVKYSSALAAVKDYDAIIIGSGLGGMTTAAFMVRYGKKVLLLEQHDVPGGFTHSFKRKGYEWDVGVHYVGQVGHENSQMRRVFDYVTDGQLKWNSMGEVYDRVVIDGTTYNFVVGYDNQIVELLKHFPEEEAAIRAYFKLVRGFPLSSGLFFGERSMPKFLSATVGWFMRRSFLKRARRTTYEVLSELTTNPKLIAVLCAQCGDYGLPPKRSSFAIHAGLVDHYLNGGYYPEGGAPAIAREIIGGIEERGSVVALKAEVAKLLVENGRAVGVRMQNGDEIRAKKIVSGAGARNTFLKLWPENVPLPAKIRKGLREIAPSVSHVCLYVGLNASDQELALPKSNYWLYDTYDFDGEYDRNLLGEFSSRPLLAYISFPSAKDPKWSATHPGKATVQVIAPCPFPWVEQWKDSRWSRRGPEYLRFKEQWREVLLNKLFTVVPQVREHVDYCEVSTPLSTQHFNRYDRGEIYGLEHTPQRMQARFLRAHTPLPGLFLTGQDVVMVGVGGALMSGVITAVATLKRNVMWRVMR